MNIEFSCANCGASLKVLKAFAGKTIQCPKCAKKALVPALSPKGDAAAAPEVATPKPAPAAPRPAPAAPPPSKPAPEAKAPVADGIYISFPCAVCSAGLKVLKSFSGKTIQCPKCAKKTLVPGGAPKEAPASQPAAPAAPAAVEASPPAPAPAVSPAPASVPAPVEKPTATAEPSPAPKPAVASSPAPAPVSTPVPAPVSAPVPVAAPAAVAPAVVEADATLIKRVREQEQKTEALLRQMEEMELKLDVARLRAEKAEQERQALETRKESDRAKLKDELSVHYQAEMEAARKTINRLEEKVQEATQARLAAAPATGARTAARIEKELLENPDEAMIESETAIPNAVMADIRESRFSRYIRTAILIHVILLGATSVGYIKHLMAKEEVAAEGEGGTNAPPVTVVSPAADAVPAVEASAPPSASAPAVKTPSAVEPSATPAAAKANTEALPAPGEKPPSDTSVELGL